MTDRSDRMPLVLVHGMSSSARAWDPLLPYLRATREVHAVALPGHRGGEPIDPRRPISTLDYVNAVERQLNDLGVTEAHLVGNSLGGWVALQLAGRGRARSVVGLAPAGGWAAAGAFDRFLAAQFSVAYWASRRLTAPGGGRLRNDPRVRRALLRGMVAKPDRVGDEQFEDLLLDIAQCDALRRSISRPESRNVASVPRIECPVLIAWSDCDRILVSRRSRRRLVAQVGRPEVQILPGVGHVPMGDDPALVSGVILKFARAADSPALGLEPAESGERA
jgi:pimeloyl-ACP methyl ester carboxylesterase